MATVIYGTTPAFSVYRETNLTLSNNTITLMPFLNKLFDTTSAYNTSTGRFQPNVAGYYQINLSIQGGTLEAGSTVQAVNAILYKNGVAVPTASDLYTFGSYVYPTAVIGASSSGSTVVYLNGSTDYIEAYVKIVVSSGSPNAKYAMMSGALLSGA